MRFVFETGIFNFVNLDLIEKEIFKVWLELNYWGFLILWRIIWWEIKEGKVRVSKGVL